MKKEQQPQEQISPEGDEEGLSQKLVREREAIYDSLFQNTGVVMLLIDPLTGSIVHANPAACRFYGYDNERLSTMTVFDLNILPKDLVLEEMNKANLNKENFFSFRHRLADGEVRDVEVYSGPLRLRGLELLHSIIHDVTERKRAEARTEESERSLRAILSVSPIGICRVKNRTFEWVNEAMCRMTGYSFEEFAGKNLRFLYANDAEYERVGGLRDAGPLCETEHRRKDGSIVQILLQSAPIDDSTRIVTVTDITGRKDAEMEQEKMGKLESLGVLAGGIAHDFNNILTMILGNVSLARMYMDKNQEKAQEKLTNAEQAIMRAKDLTQQLLTFSKGGAPIKKVVAIGDFLKDVCQFTLIGTSVVCKFDLASDLLPVEIDEGQVTQAVGHIVINGSQAMPNGGTIVVQAENAIMDTPTPHLKAGRYVKISIIDQGIGIPEDHLNKIFDPYFTTKQKGSGLGLAIAYSVIKNHGGHIAVESALGVGTTFHVYLPVFQGILTSERNLEQSLPPSGARILVMDDEDSIRDLVGDILNLHGYAVDFAKNGEEAVALYQEHAYDAVMLDLTVPGGMGGKETVKELLKIDPHARAIVSSGYSSDPIMSEYAQYGFKDVIAKPYKIDELGEVIRRVIARGSSLS
ncbi:MAG TPA: PAS domain S-box protein [Syntrophorhabdaceae bacterium]|nr:PAS domain S-box protein [Syntrophorhabdaceae bacterium]